jgi:hypothetical protein
MFKLTIGLAAAAALFLGSAGSAEAQHPLHPHHHNHHRSARQSTFYRGPIYVSPYSRSVYSSGYGGYGGYGDVGVTSYYGGGFGGYNSGYRYNSYRPSYGGGYGEIQLDPYHTYHQYPHPHIHHNHW